MQRKIMLYFKIEEDIKMKPQAYFNEIQRCESEKLRYYPSNEIGKLYSEIIMKKRKE